MNNVNRPTSDNPVINTETVAYKTVWEYKTLSMHWTRHRNGDIDEKMNELGCQGYECFQVAANGDFHILYFKRARVFSII